MAVALRHRHVLDHGETHGLGCAETESARIADVERHDFVALALELLGAPRETSANLVLDVAQALAGADLGFLGHRDSQKRGRRENNSIAPRLRARAARNRAQFTMSRQRRQATWCESSTDSVSGRISAHVDSAAEQRVRKAHPLGRSTADGVSPCTECIASRARSSAGSSSGTDSNN